MRLKIIKIFFLDFIHFPIDFDKKIIFEQNKSNKDNGA
jgi:hypothetical protein